MVMLTTNMLWGIDVVPLGLCHGSRGRAVGGHVWDSNVQFVVVDFPTYRGHPFFEGVGRETWVPVGMENIPSKSASDVVRCALPLVLSWAMTGHKSQGLGMDILGVDLRAVHMKPVRLPGWLFVALTRATSGDRVAIRGLPGLEEFVKVREDTVFRWRERAEVRFDEQHEAFMNGRGISREVEVEMHMAALPVETTEAERERVMDDLARRGMREIPEETRVAIRNIEVVEVPVMQHVALPGLCGGGAAGWRDGNKKRAREIDAVAEFAGAVRRKKKREGGVLDRDGNVRYPL